MYHTITQSIYNQISIDRTMEEKIRSVVKLGAGYAVVLPVRWVRYSDILQGDKVWMRATKDGELVIRAPAEWEKLFDGMDNPTTSYICLGGGKSTTEIGKSVVKFGTGYVVVLPQSWIRYFELSGDDKILISINKNMELVIKVPNVKKQLNIEMEKERQKEEIQEKTNMKRTDLHIELDKPMYIRRTYAKDKI